MRQVFLILMLFFAVVVFGQKHGQNSLMVLNKADSLQILKYQNRLKSANDKEKLELYYQLASTYLSKIDSIANTYAELLIEKATASNQAQYRGRALFLKGKINSTSSSIRALDYYQEATKILEDYADQALKDIYYKQSQIHTLFSEFPEALDLGFKSLEFNKINNIEANVLRDMSLIGYIYDRMYEFKESIKWNREALKIAKKIGDQNGEALCYGRIGIAFDELAEKDNFNERLFDSALYYNKKAARLSESINNLAFSRTTYSNIGNTYSKLKDYKKAEEYTLKSLAVPGFESRKGVTLVNLGKIYLETKRFSEAKKVLDSAMRNTLKYGTRKYQLEAYYRFHELDVKKGDYKSALNNYIEYKSIEDSLLNETKTRQIAEMGERYKTADKERQILIHRTDLAERDLTIQKRNSQLFGTIAFAVVLTFIGYLFYNQQKLRNQQLQKESELKDALLKIETQNRLQEQRLRISRDLHDNIGAQLAFIISSIDNLKYGFDITDQKLKDKLTSISNFTTETIYELRDTIWAMNKTEITFEDLQSRLSNYIDKAHVFEGKVDFSFQVDPDVDLKRKFNSMEGVNIHRVIQEAIHNSLKHSNSKNIEVKVEKFMEHLKFTISDDGQGFDMTTVEKGNGLLNMQKRIHEIGGKFEIESFPNHGTKISFVI
ncbi:tetratricopeptide repeat-containing sensor histidine kinase [Gelidibacter pelagius]|uniref:histidine kinase n=1 Tax=Gelidibacter pelagius TaxID=2819985 RepID=A0ABS3SP71_9FLAO|nr:sensor histidine kinase [Gelidibacter pelagius]MBO3097502.1 sensor histidine kinase [Gelidibacter pelagius]